MRRNTTISSHISTQLREEMPFWIETETSGKKVGDQEKGYGRLMVGVR